MWDSLMERYKIPSLDALLSTWNRAQVYVAMDSMFWNNPKETKHYGIIPKQIDLSTLQAGGIFRSLGMF